VAGFAAEARFKLRRSQQNEGRERSRPFLFCVSSSSAKADDPVLRGFSIATEAGDYWMPAFAGMTGGG
jgi:hypothetical protein